MTRINRRTLLKWFVGIGALSAVGAVLTGIGTVRPAGSEEGRTEIKGGERLVFALGSNKGEPIRKTSILPGQATLAFPEGKEAQDNLIIVLHFSLDELKPPTKLEWCPEGFVTYSAICTHLGCTVNYSHEPMPSAPFPHIHCPCHAGMFNPLAGAQVVSGPPPRPLPQLPLEINAKGELVAAGPFEEPPGVLQG